jgi:sulfur-oxidizing protein SoxZ
MATTRISMPQTARRGEVIEIKTLIQHEMETGYRRDGRGLVIPRDIISELTVTYGGAIVFRGNLDAGISANPYFAFHLRAIETGEIVFKWTDERGNATTVSRRLTVT